MTAGPALSVNLIAGITSIEVSERKEWADAAGFQLNDYDGLDNDERRAVAPGHVWCMCIEPDPRVREYFLHSIDSLAILAPISPVILAEVLAWLAVTGTDPRAEVDYVEALTEIVESSSAVPEIALTPERAAPLVDVLRGVTSASGEERARAARIVPDLLAGLRHEEQWGLTGVLARAAIVEDDTAVRDAQLHALLEAHSAGAVHGNDARLLTATFADASPGTVEHRVVKELGTA